MDIDLLPDSIIKSTILSKKHLQQLARESDIPSIDPAFEDDMLKNIFQYYSLNPDEMEIELHSYAARLLDDEKVKEAWQILLALA